MEDLYTSEYKVKTFVDPVTGETRQRKIRPHRIDFEASKARGEPSQKDSGEDVGMKEETEINEISSTLAGNYYGAATKKHLAKVGMKADMYNRIEKDMGKKRKEGVDRALDRITGARKTNEETEEQRKDREIQLKRFKDQLKEDAELDQQINEVLSKDASAGEWISDFVKSENPKFAGKSKTKRKQMALAAYYAKQRNEEAELKGKQKKLDKNHNGKLDAQDFKILRKEETELMEANHREFASQGKMHPDMAKHMNVGDHMDYYEPKTGDKVHGKVMHKSATEVHMKQTHDSYDPKKKGTVHKFAITNKLDEATVTSHSHSHVLKKIKEGEWEASSDVKPGKHVEIRDTKTNKRKMIHVQESTQNVKPTVDTKKYSWGTMKTVHHGSSFSIPLHPEHHQAIAKLKDEQEHHFKDETGRHWTARRKGEDVHFQGANGGNSTHVKHSTMSEGYDDNRRGFGKRPREDDEYHVPDPEVKNKVKKEETEPPFAKPYKTVVANIKDKSGAIHTPMSRVRDLARKARDMEANAKNSETEVVKEDAYTGLEKEPKMGLKTAVIKKSKNAVETDTVEGWDHPHQAVKKESFNEDGTLVEAMISYSDFHAKMAAHKAAGNRIVDYKHGDNKAHYTVVDKEGTARKITHTPSGQKMENLGPHKSDEHGNDDKESGKKSEPGVKRGRGRPAGSKSGANQKVTTGKHSGVDYTGHKLHLPNRNN